MLLDLTCTQRYIGKHNDLDRSPSYAVAAAFTSDAGVDR